MGQYQERHQISLDKHLANGCLHMWQDSVWVTYTVTEFGMAVRQSRLSFFFWLFFNVYFELYYALVFPKPGLLGKLKVVGKKQINNEEIGYWRKWLRSSPNVTTSILQHPRDDNSLRRDMIAFLFHLIIKHTDFINQCGHTICCFWRSIVAPSARPSDKLLLVERNMGETRFSWTFL